MSDPAPFFAMIFLFFYESKWFKSIKNANYGVTRKCGLIFRFIDGLITINDGNEFENHYKEIYPPQVILKEENTSHTESTFLKLHSKDSYSFNVVTLFHVKAAPYH